MTSSKTYTHSKEFQNFTATEVVLPGISKPNGLVLRQRLLSNPSKGQVIIKVEATGISFAERAMMRGKYPGMPTFPFVLGYDLVGIVVAIGEDVDIALLGKRFGVLTKTGGWSSYVEVPANTLLSIPDGVDPVEAEALLVNGITAWQMLHRKAKIKKGQTILVLGANGGVGSILTQLAINTGVIVIGASAPKHHDTMKKQGVVPIDYNDAKFSDTVRRLAPEGIDSVFDNIGGESISRSFDLLKPGGILVSYAIAFALNINKSVIILFVELIAKLWWLNIVPNGRKAVFYDIWSNKGSDKFKTEMKEDFMELMLLLQNGVLKPQIAAKFSLEKITDAMEFAESRTSYGKVIVLP